MAITEREMCPKQWNPEEQLVKGRGEPHSTVLHLTRATETQIYVHQLKQSEMVNYSMIL
jgi:hypothetical protein